MKVCTTCGDVKSLHDFHKKRNGHHALCKLCRRQYEKDRRVSPEYREPILLSDRSRPHRMTKERSAKYKLSKLTASRARTKVSNWVRLGKITRPNNCEDCDSDFHIEGHHDDYLKPLDVRWLCSACHSQWHTTNGEALNAYWISRWRNGRVTVW